MVEAIRELEEQGGDRRGGLPGPADNGLVRVGGSFDATDARPRRRALIFKHLDADERAEFEELLGAGEVRGRG